MAYIDKSLAIAYRIYPKVSKTPPIFSDDKFKLSELCLKSFCKCLKGVSYKFWAILDGCPGEYEALFKKYIPSEQLECVHTPSLGNALTFRKQIDILLNQEYSENIYLAEDDYFYHNSQIKEMLDFIADNNDSHFISPYDTLDYYTFDLHKYKSEIRISNSRHWRTSGTTCMTFMTTKKILTETQNIFFTYTKKNWDTSLWLSLTKHNITNPFTNIKFLFKGAWMAKIFIKSWIYSPLQNIFGKKYKLWIPIPSIATHMDSRYLAPTKDWERIFRENL